MAIFMVRVSFCYSILKLDKVFKIIFLLTCSQAANSIFPLGIICKMKGKPSWGVSYFWQKSWPQFLQWWRLSVSEKRTAHAEHPSTCSSFTQWSAAERPGCSLTDQLKTRPRPSPTTTLLWSLRVEQECHIITKLQNKQKEKKKTVWCLSKYLTVTSDQIWTR